MSQIKFEEFVEDDPKLRAFMESETMRKEAVLELFSDLEYIERRVKRKPQAIKKYDRVVRGVGRVVKKSKSTLHLRRLNGSRMANLNVTPHLCELMFVGDELDLILGWRDGEWRVLALFTIGSYMSNVVEATKETNPNLN